VSVLEELSDAAQAAAAKGGASVVRIGGNWRGGTGFVVGDGVVVTNAHNVRAERVLVVFADGRRAEATLRGIDPDGDLAALAVDTAGAQVAEWAPATPQLGAAVFGIGLTASGEARLTVGFVSALGRRFRGPRGRRISGAIEHTAPLAPGSSGGPLLDVLGRVIGINTSREGNGFYLALPADAGLRSRVEALAMGESPRRARLGVGLAPAYVARRMQRAVGLPERDGLLVREVEGGSPAEAAGIAEGDLLAAAAGRPLAEADDLYEALAELGSSAVLELTVVRGTDERTVSVRFDASPATGSDEPVH
jgi:serine protease Do